MACREHSGGQDTLLCDPADDMCPFVEQLESRVAEKSLSDCPHLTRLLQRAGLLASSGMVHLRPPQPQAAMPRAQGWAASLQPASPRLPRAALHW